MSREIYDDETEIIHYSDGYDAPGDYFDPPSVGNTGLTAGRRSRNGVEDTRKFAKRIPAGQNLYAQPTLRASRTTDHSLIAQYPAYDEEWEPEPGRRYPARRDGKVVPRQTSTSSQPVRRTEPRQRAVQPQRYVESRQVNTGPVMGRRALVRKLFTGAVLIGVTGALSKIPSVMEQNDLNQNHFAQGDIPGKTKYCRVGHNDAIHRTILNFRVSDDVLVFEETPGGVRGKSVITPIWTLEELKYTGHIADLFLDIDVTPVGKRFTVELTVKWYEPYLLLWHQFTPATGTILVDLGHGFFELPPAK